MVCGTREEAGQERARAYAQQLPPVSKTGTRTPESIYAWRHRANIPHRRATPGGGRSAWPEARPPTATGRAEQRGATGRPVAFSRHADFGDVGLAHLHAGPR